VQAKRHLDEPDVKSIPPTFLKPSNMAWAALSLTTSEVETCGVAFEMTADAQADSSVNFQILLDGLPIGVTVAGQTGMPKPDSLEIGIHKITCWFKDMQPAGVFFTNAIAIVNQKMPKVRYLAPFTVSLLTERTGDRLSYNDDVNPKNDWPRYICTPKEAEIFITGNAQRKFQKLEGEMSALLENIQGNKSFPTCRFWPNEVCFLGTKCCLQFYHDPKRPARSVRHREESDTADRNAPGGPRGGRGGSHGQAPVRGGSRNGAGYGGAGSGSGMGSTNYGKRHG